LAAYQDVEETVNLVSKKARCMNITMQVPYWTSFKNWYPSSAIQTIQLLASASQSVKHVFW